MSTFELPDLGEGLQDAQIVAWHVSVGDHVVTDQPLISVETEKAVVEIPSPQAGQIAQLYGQVGDVIAVGSSLVRFDEDGQRDSESVVGELPHLPAQRVSVPELAPTSSGAPAPDQYPTVRAAPAVRQLARERGVDLTTITGTGPGGSITSRDIEVHPQRGEADSTLLHATRETLSGTRRAMAGAMAMAGAQIVPASVCADADITQWQGINDLMVRLVSAMVAGCTAQPALNVWYDTQSGERILHKQVDIGIAVDTDHGLVVPVLRNAQALSPGDASNEISRLTKQTHDRTINIQELKGQTITLSNFGSLAGRYANLVVIPPQVAILGAGQISDRVVAHDAMPAVRRVLPLSLTFDHRVVSGAEAARFLRSVIESLQGDEEFA